jgi:hypothetical protein
MWVSKDRTAIVPKLASEPMNKPVALAESFKILNCIISETVDPAKGVIPLAVVAIYSFLCAM